MSAKQSPTGTFQPGPHAAAQAAASDYLNALWTEFGRPPADIDLQPHHAPLREAFDRVRPGLADPVITAADAALDQVFSTVELTGVTNSDILSTQARSGLGRVSAAVDAALTTFDRQPDLDAAGALVDQLATEQARALAGLEQAVAAADIEAVMSLRPKVEVELPVRLGKARLALLDLQIARVEAEQQQAARRHAPVVETVEDAERELHAATDRLEHAKAALLGAQARRMQAAGSSSTIQTRIATMTADRDRLAADVADDHARRLRRLAGLPEPTAPEPTPVPPAQAHRRPDRQVGVRGAIAKVPQTEGPRVERLELQEGTRW